MLDLLSLTAMSTALGILSAVLLEETQLSGRPVAINSIFSAFNLYAVRSFM